MRIAAALSIALLLAGCGGAGKRAATTTTVAAPAQPVGLRVGVVGDLSLRVPGATIRHVSLRRAADETLVLVAAEDQASANLPAQAAVHPGTHWVLVGGSAAAQRLPNLAGIVLRDDQAARLGGIVAGLAVREGADSSARVAWVGPQERALAAAFVRGVHESAPGTTVLRAWSPKRPAACKESALGAIARGATVVMAARGLCAEAAIAGAHERNQPGLQLSDFELPAIPASVVVRDAVRGVFHGREDIVFGAASGAIAVRHLDSLFSATVGSAARAAAQQLATGRSFSG
jgi:basic membrane lipoprotein Med (substrate-binding protein (PBP1-ABC) superfamily)